MKPALPANTSPSNESAHELNVGTADTAPARSSSFTVMVALAGVPSVYGGVALGVVSDMIALTDPSPATMFGVATNVQVAVVLAAAMVIGSVQSVL